MTGTGDRPWQVALSFDFTWQISEWLDGLKEGSYIKLSFDETHLGSDEDSLVDITAKVATIAVHCDQGDQVHEWDEHDHFLGYLSWAVSENWAGFEKLV